MGSAALAVENETGIKNRQKIATNTLKPFHFFIGQSLLSFLISHKFGIIVNGDLGVKIKERLCPVKSLIIRVESPASPDWNRKWSWLQRKAQA